MNALQCKNTNLSLGEFFVWKGGKMYQVLSGGKLKQITYSVQFLESSLITRYIMIAATLYQVFTCAGHSAKYFTCSFSAHYHSPAGVRRYFPSTSEETRFRISSELRCKARSVLTSKPSFFFLLEYTYLTMCMTMWVNRVCVRVCVDIKPLPHEPPPQPPNSTPTSSSPVT